MAVAKRVWSKYQQDVFADVANGKGHTIVQSRAGSGKTSTIVEALKYIPKKVNGKATTTLLIAFNKSTQQELHERCPSYVDCLTLHSLGFRAIKNSLGKTVALDPNKTLNIVQTLLAEKGIKKQDKTSWPTTLSMLRMISLCKSYLIDVPSKMDDLMDRFDIDVCKLDREDFIKMACAALRACRTELRCVDFDDMIWLPVLKNMPLGKWDRVFVDEAHDLSDAQIQMALSACKDNGRVVAVLDPRQAIYSWRGADNNVVNNLIKRLDAKILPLSTTYRCAKAITKLAQEIVPDIECPDTAKEGTVIYESDTTFLAKVRTGDFILSRTNAPLIYYCLALLKMDIPANIQGKDLGANLSWMIKKSETKTIEDFFDWLDEWEKLETERLLKKHRDPIIIHDKAECLRSLCENERSLDAVLDKIKTLFQDGDDTTRVICSTIHRAKGAERDRVFLLYDTCRLGMNDEEDNIVYVGITRARIELYVVSKHPKLPDEPLRYHEPRS